MNEFSLFLVGCFVSLIVLSAVGLLLWGAAQEPRGGVVPERKGARALRPVPARIPVNDDRAAG